MSELGYEFFMQECDSKGNTLAGSEPKNLEVDFRGLRYSKIDGIETIGVPKNVYSESFADADRLRVYVPSVVKHKETVVTLTLFFLGERRQEVLDNFNAYITNKFHRYWDTARNKWFAFYIKDELKPAESMRYGSTPYLRMDYKLVNIFGRTFDVE
jgi:hypothetical protein